VSVAIVDHGAGNLRSLRAGLARAGAAAVVTADPDEVAAAGRLVLPGVGSAAAAMARMRERGLAEAVLHAAGRGAHVLGICLGMQLLFSRSDEGDCDCLGLMEGSVRRIDWSRRVPHMGWNDVRASAPHPLTRSLPAVYYFAHSFAVDPGDGGGVLATTDLDGVELASMVGCGRVAGAQFHPEKSGAAGGLLLARFLEWSRDAA